MSTANSQVDTDLPSVGGEPVVVTMVQEGDTNSDASSNANACLLEGSSIPVVGVGEDGPQASSDFVDLTGDDICQAFFCGNNANSQ